MLTGRLNLSALNDNFNLLQGMTSRQQWLMPALKANAYGHGVQAVAPLLHRRARGCLPRARHLTHNKCARWGCDSRFCCLPAPPPHSRRNSQRQVFWLP